MLFRLLVASTAVLAAVLGVGYHYFRPLYPRRLAIIECEGGTDKAAHGHRADTPPLQRAFERHGYHADIIFFADDHASWLAKELPRNYTAVMSRVDPGDYLYCTEGRLHAFLRTLNASGMVVFNHPDIQHKMGSKASLLKLEGMPLANPDAYHYHSFEHFVSHFAAILPQMAADGRMRVLKQNRGSKGEGVWRVAVNLTSGGVMGVLAEEKTVDEQQQQAQRVVLDRRNGKAEGRDGKGKGNGNGNGNGNASTGSSSNSKALIVPKKASIQLTPDTMLVLTEAKDNHEESRTFQNFTSFFERYFEEQGDSVVNQAYLTRISEGEIRVILSGRTILKVVERRPDASTNSDAFSANLGAMATHDYYDPRERPSIVDFLHSQLGEMLDRLDVSEPPVLWTCDFIRDGPPERTVYILSEINAACVGFSGHPPLADLVAQRVIDTVERIKRGR
ncbi:unnamed protein product [Vitrella brassicaformis CCMP3155]|uniref:DUF6815 domain-containing protein n=2 Tax=Vitrella brassicaformis TaxID=1169539 RepID=A0A0G4ESB3_VITBC|nr:unnamed protein product [Vitrella brassicaformis CCMP3155]|eukprot:CEM00755.1 unnamed protein product [Vitrella brassicaformis CCMP3155]